MEIVSWIRYVDNIHTLSENMKHIYIYSMFGDSENRDTIPKISTGCQIFFLIIFILRTD
jgi:hypothetical protein